MYDCFLLIFIVIVQHILIPCFIFPYLPSSILFLPPSLLTYLLIFILTFPFFSFVSLWLTSLCLSLSFTSLTLCLSLSLSLSVSVSLLHLSHALSLSVYLYLYLSSTVSPTPLNLSPISLSLSFACRCRPVRSDSVAEVLLEDFLNRILLVYGGRIPHWASLDEGHSRSSKCVLPTNLST